MNSKRFTVLIVTVLALGQSALAEYAELRQEKNQFNKMQTGAGIVQPVGTTGNQFKAAIFFASPTHASTVAGKREPQADGAYRLQHTRVGIAYYGRVFQYQFGSVISPPNKDADGNDLAANASPLDYWKAEPHNAYKAELSTTAEYGRFYWSASAEKVYATRPGPADIVWVKKMPVATANNPTVTGAGWATETISNSLKLHSKTVSSKVTEMWQEENAVFYSAAVHRVIISGSPSKPVKRIYWTGTRYPGVSVTIPDSRISKVKVVYNDAFPKNVPNDQAEKLAEEGLGNSGLSTSSGVAVQTQTLWYSKTEKALKALNKEGRVFVEFLGQIMPGTNIPESLGFEVVDVVKEPVSQLELVELGDPFPILQPVAKHAAGTNLNLFPQVANLPEGKSFVMEHYFGGLDVRPTFYAIRETMNTSDLIMWWLIEGVQGIKWPERYVRYDLKWPSDPAKYSHYVRPAVSNEEDAKATAVALPTRNTPAIAYQDDSGFPRGKLTPEYKYFTYLKDDFPVHRALLQFTSGDHVYFERVASWLQANVQANEYPENRITTSFGVSDADGKLTSQYFQSTGVANSKAVGTITFPEKMEAPRVVAGNLTVVVGSRVPTPSLEHGGASTESYLAGYIQSGTSYYSDAYVDPLKNGFDEANKGAIIPVNAIPGQNNLEILWFRKNTMRWVKDDVATVVNEATQAQLLREQQGFDAVYWPSVIGTYTIKWPHENSNYLNASKDTAIVMASNDGSGPLNSLQAKGSIYFQNDATLPGYNPNEEHAIMQGGQLYALRNDLNLTSSASVTKISDETYSSEPYVLLSYTGSDDRPAMRAFRVMQELGEDTFDYTVEAGTILQAPMPLPLMQKLKNNKEFSGSKITEAAALNGENNGKNLAPLGRLYGNTAAVTVTVVQGVVYSFVKGANEVSLLNGAAAFTASATFKAASTTVTLFGKANMPDNFVTAEIRNISKLHSIRITTEANHGFSVKDVVHLSRFSESGNNGWAYVEKKVNATTVEVTRIANPEIATLSRLKYDIATKKVTLVTSKPHGIESGDKVKVLLSQYWDYYTGVEIELTGEYTVLSVTSTELIFSPGTFTESLTLDSPPNADHLTRMSHSSLDMDVLHLTATVPVTSTIDSANPPLANLQKPTDLGSYTSTTMMDRKDNVWVYRGPHTSSDLATFKMRYYYKTLAGFWFPGLSQQPVVGTTIPYLQNDPAAPWPSGSYAPRLAKAIKYNATWPSGVAELRPGQTLTAPVFGLPAVRGNTSLKILYQQAAALDPSDSSATLHDPTREKVYDMATGAAKLVELPASVVTMSHKGKTYFTRLPPHLVDRFFFDPMRGKKGQLVFRGEFVDEIVGEDYLLMNVLSGKDLNDLKKLADPNMGNTKWNNAIAGLTAKVETFKESANKFGVFVPYGKPAIVPASNLVKITSDETAVDSYALSANGNKAGYVTLIAGDGQAFTPKAEPVQMHVIKVGGSLYRGEAKVILSDNPLAEKVTFMHTGDLAGSTDKFDYDWRIAAPEDGLPPAVSERNPISGATATIPTTGWKHLRQIPTAGVPASSDARWVAAGLGTVTVQESSTVSAISFVTVADQFDTIEVTASGASAFKVGDFVNLVGFIPTTLNAEGLEVKAVNGTKLELAKDTVAGLPVAQTFGTIEESLVGVTASSAGSVLAGEFQVPPDKVPTDVYLSMTADPNLGVRVKVGSAVVAVKNVSTIAEGDADSTVSSAPSSFQPLSLVYGVDTSLLSSSGVNKITVEMWSDAKPGASLAFNLKLEANELVDKVMVAGSKWLARKNGNDLRSIIIGESADVQALSDNYIVMRYRATESSHLTWNDTDGDSSTNEGWSPWTEPQLAEGWIKRVLAGINPFNQRAGDLFSNAVDTSGSILTQAGKRWEGDVALNMENINDYGLIEIYETVMGRGRMLSIDAGIDYGPANDALLLAAGYINDLYMMLGNEAWADAANPTIGIGTKDKTYGDIATALFAFKGQVASLLEEELALLRGRDDFLQPGVEAAPVYNRLFWNYTRGIDSGEVIYALNYNIQEDNDSGYDGKVNAEDAYKMFPQGHGDSYGHFLTAMKGYYKLLVDNDFTWVPRTEAVTILGKPVQVDYTDERKFAAAAAAIARAGKQVVDLTWRKDYNADKKINWEKEFSPTRDNTRRTQSTTRHWGMDQWASRTGQGALINWVVGNSMLPEIDPDPSHEGIQKIDRSTVPELTELTATVAELQVTLDNAEAGLNPLGLSEGSVAMDVSPYGGSHFEQVYERAGQALVNATIAFDSTKDMTQLMRSEQDSLVDLQASVDQQELSYKYELIELYGTPYPDDIGPGRTYKQGYDGPDLYHFVYVDGIGLSSIGDEKYYSDKDQQFKLDIQTNPIEMDKVSTIKNNISSNVGVFKVVNAVLKVGFGANFFFDSGSTNFKEKGDEVVVKDDNGNYQFLSGEDGVRFNMLSKNLKWENEDYAEKNYVSYTLSASGNYAKPNDWLSRRTSPGEIQLALADIQAARSAALGTFRENENIKYQLDRELEVFESRHSSYLVIKQLQLIRRTIEDYVEKIKKAKETAAAVTEATADAADDTSEIAAKAVPGNTIAGTAVGGDFLSSVKSVLKSVGKGIVWVAKSLVIVAKKAFDYMVQEASGKRGWIDNMVRDVERQAELKEEVLQLEMRLNELQLSAYDIFEKLQLLDDAKARYRALVAKGERLQEEREIFRQRSAAVVQGFRTRDAAFRVFRNEKLERYKALQDMASKYAFLAAQAFDYETGLLGTDEGRKFINRIINSRALGVVVDGQPQFAGSNTGDPGISSVLAEMKNDWDALKGRLGFNNPDQYSTTVSLRSEKHRILPGQDGVLQWGDVLEGSRSQNIMTDDDVRRYCMQAGFEDARPVPGLIIEFSTTIDKEKNLFGLPLAGGDSQFSPASFATKIFSVGVALEGYIGMGAPNTNDQGGQSPSNPTPPWLDPNALSKTPYVYLIPVGVDYMRSPPLGDTSQIRSWSVQDVAIPLPFNIGDSEHSTKKLWQSSASLTDQLFAIRKHQPFRAVDSGDTLGGISITIDQSMNDSNYTNRRLIGRSVWNSKWKLVIPGYTLLNDSEEGLDRFIQTVNDIKIYFNTYSYSGN
ncbi:MAG: hypothetical protein HOH62_06050 [Verrucomicrobia bacterium]|jgi:hypothetical protein|nr:hypothetical protein [Verrucomicrobiota bacterium]